MANLYVSFDQFDDPIRKILEKAERLAHEKEQLENQFNTECKKIDEQIRQKTISHRKDVEKLADIREQLGRLRIGRSRKIRQIKDIKEKISKAQALRRQYQEYFRAIDTLTGDDLVNAREEIIGEQWQVYGQMLDEYRSYVGIEDIPGQENNIAQLKEDISIISLEMSKLERVEQLIISKIEVFLEEHPNWTEK